MEKLFLGRQKLARQRSAFGTSNRHNALPIQHHHHHHVDLMRLICLLLLLVALAILSPGAQAATKRVREPQKLAAQRAPVAAAAPTSKFGSPEESADGPLRSGDLQEKLLSLGDDDDNDYDEEAPTGGKESEASKPLEASSAEEEEEEGGHPTAGCGLNLLRLPERIVPTHYDLIVMPDFETLSFEGAVQIDLAVRAGGREDRRQRRRRISVGRRTEPPMSSKLQRQRPQKEATSSSGGNEDSSQKRPQRLAAMLSTGRTRASEPANNQLVLHADASLTVGNVWYFDFGPDSLSAQEEPPSSGGNSSSSSGRGGASQPGRGRKRGGDDGGGGYIEVLEVCQDAEFELLVVTLAKDLQLGSRGQLHLAFAGNLSDDMRGFYKSAYPSSRSNGTRFHATTQFQATEARRAFPCFDEPALKATFDVALIHPSDRLALANMEPISEQLLVERQPSPSPSPAGGDSKAQEGAILGTTGAGPPPAAAASQLLVEHKLTRFARTPPMSTYLLAFVVGEFDFVEEILPPTKRGDNKLRVRVYTPLGKSKQGLFALETACRAIGVMQDYFGIAFPLRKLDLVAIPDFDAGAMENWGLITFRESQVLFDELNTTPETKALVASTVVHEIAHQWFGNLVTMEWWNELWLNEGFATWMEYKVSAELYPEFDFPFRYLLDSHIYALAEDSFRSAHPIEPQALENTNEIDEIFDAISYNKAAAIIKILHDDYLKPQLFKTAIRQYLASNKYANTETTDLWQSMESFGQLPVLQFMQSWLSQAGHPLVRLSFDPATNWLTIEQERFVANAGPTSDKELSQRWIIPFSMLVSVEHNSNGDGEQTSKQSSKQEMLYQFVLDRARGVHFKLPVAFNASQTPLGNSSCWLKLNSNFSGFYRVQYPDSLYQLMRAPIQKGNMLAADRLNILDETCTLAITNRVPLMRLLDTILWFANESHGAVIYSLVESYESLAEFLKEDSSLSEKFRLFGGHFFGKFYSRFGGVNGGLSAMRTHAKQERSHMEMRARAAVLNLLVNLNYERAIDDSIKLVFAPTATAAATVGPNVTANFQRIAAFELREPIYAAIAKAGSDSQQDWLLAKLASTTSREERTRLAVSLARATKLDRLARIWRLLKQKSLAIDLDQKIRAVESLLSSKEGLEFALKLSKERGRKEIAGIETLILRELILSGKVISQEQAQLDFPHLLVDGATKEPEWPEEANGLIEIRGRRLKALRESSNEIKLALDRYLANNNNNNNLR